MHRRFSPAYIQHRQRGAFPGAVDPWAEDAHYFQQIHSGMIYALQDQLQDELNARGYQVGKEASLQIFAVNRKPDMFIVDTLAEREPFPLDYDAVAAALHVEPGTAVLDSDADMEALHITDMETGALITVIEVISPRNKTHPLEMALYREQRARLFLDHGVNVVEIDATRSPRRLLAHPLVESQPYHIAVHLPGDVPRALTSGWLEGLKPFALPLRAEAVRVEPQAAYDRAYQRGGIAGLIEQNGHYVPDRLPFPSLLSDSQRANALEHVTAWRAQLARLAV